MNNNIKLKRLSDVKTSFFYKVEKNETVFSLADKFHTTIESIVKINALTEDVRYGQFVLIEKIDGELYFVKPTDTILSVASYDNEKSIEIVAKNKIEYVYVGQKLYI